ncbi:MAG: redox-sensing transcriptional repressor Rex [Candidatus Omnitrophica bacterium]|nr:redox-sensing transcriptional repressor Rex [Candidatus Omnitrophota bacterium]
MKNPVRSVVSRSSLKRLPLYLHLLEKLSAEGVARVSCTYIAKEFDFDPTQVRKDLEATGEVGTARIGFRVASLIGRVKELLGWNDTHDAYLVGVGNMGKALLGYRDFEKYGLRIVAAFDKDPQKIKSHVFGREILPMSTLLKVASKTPARIGIVTVPADQAQEAVDLLVVSGVKAIWNFAPAPIRIPRGVILENARLTRSLAVLTNNLVKKT